MDCPRINLRGTDGTLLVRDGFILSFFCQHPHQDMAAHVVRVLSAYQQFIGSTTLRWYIDHEGYAAELDAGVQSQLLKELVDTTAWPSYTLCLEDSEADASGFSFEYESTAPDTNWPDATSLVSLWFPTEFLAEAGPDVMRQFGDEIARLLPFASGYGSLAFNYSRSPDLREAFARIHERCFDYPGMDVHLNRFARLDIGQSIRGIYWLNYWSAYVVDALGGAEGLHRHIQASEAEVETLGDDRAAVILGPEPEAGDLPADRHLPSIYKRLTGQLAHSHHLGFFRFPTFSAEAMYRWVWRLLS